MDSKSLTRLMKIKIPHIDNSALLARSSKVLMGRCLKLLFQNVDTFIFMIPQFWNLVGHVSGLNLGNRKFQFEFNSEADLASVLNYSSVNFDGWMISYAPWKAMADADYPNTIRFWIRITWIPFEYRVEEVYRLVLSSGLRFQRVRTLAIREKNEGVKKGRGIPQHKPLLDENDKVIGEEVAKETLSSKKVRRPLFHEETRGIKENSKTALMAVDLSPEDPTLDSVLESIEIDVGQSNLKTTHMAAMQNGVDIGSRVEMLGADSGQMEDSVLDAIAFEAIMHSRHNLTEAQMAQIHDEFVAKLQNCKEARLTKPAHGPGKPTSRGSTPLQGVCTRKMSMLGKMSPRKTPRNSKPKEGKTKDQDKCSIKF